MVFAVVRTDLFDTGIIETYCGFYRQRTELFDVLVLSRRIVVFATVRTQLSDVLWFLPPSVTELFDDIISL